MIRARYEVEDVAHLEPLRIVAFQRRNDLASRGMHRVCTRHILDLKSDMLIAGKGHI